jgi:hypothetical protein
MVNSWHGTCMYILLRDEVYIWVYLDDDVGALLFTE